MRSGRKGLHRRHLDRDRLLHRAARRIVGVHASVGDCSPTTELLADRGAVGGAHTPRRRRRGRAGASACPHLRTARPGPPRPPPPPRTGPSGRTRTSALAIGALAARTREGPRATSTRRARHGGRGQLARRLLGCPRRTPRSAPPRHPSRTTSSATPTAALATAAVSSFASSVGHRPHRAASVAAVAAWRTTCGRDAGRACIVGGCHR